MINSINKKSLRQAKKPQLKNCNNNLVIKFFHLYNRTINKLDCTLTYQRVTTRKNKYSLIEGAKR